MRYSVCSVGPIVRIFKLDWLIFDLDIWLVAQLTIQMAFDSKYSNQRLTVLSVKHEWDAITVPGQHGSAGLSDLPYEQNTV